MTTVTTDDPPKAPSKRVDLGRVVSVLLLLAVLYAIIWTTATVSFHRGEEHVRNAGRATCTELARVGVRILINHDKPPGVPPIRPCKP